MDTVWWGEALNTAAYVANRSPNSAIQYELPEERYTAGEVNVGHLRVFGSQCVVHVLRHKRKKFDPSGVKGIFVGYGETRKAYRIQMADGTVRNERNVTVFERPVRKSESVLPSGQCPGGEVTDHQDSVGDEPSEHSSGGESSDELNEEEDFASADDDEQIPRRIGRIRRTTSNPDFVYRTDIEPATYEGAMRSAERSEWEEAMEKEMGSLNKYGTWEIVQRPTNVKIVGNRWVFQKSGE